MVYRVGLLPRDVARSTPHELSAVIDARLEAASIDREFIAAMTATLLRAWSKRAPRHTELLGEGDRRRAVRRLQQSLAADKRAKQE